MKNQIMSCEFNIDTACIEVKLTDGSMVSIDCKNSLIKKHIAYRFCFVIIKKEDL